MCFFVRFCTALARMLMTDDACSLSLGIDWRVLFLFRDPAFGRRTNRVLLQDTVPFTGADASCGVSRIKCCLSVPSRAQVGPSGSSRFFLSSVVMDDEIIIDSVLHTDPGSKRRKTKQTSYLFFIFISIFPCFITEFHIFALIDKNLSFLKFFFFAIFMSSEPPVDPKTIPNLRSQSRNDF